MKIKLLVGATGVGKTWVMRQLIKKFNCSLPGKVGMVYYMRSPDWKYVVVGKYEGGVFDGSDQLSMAVMADWTKFTDIWGPKAKLIFIEGQRFTNKTIMALTNVEIVKILGDGASGRKLRGSSQSERQIKSVATMVSNVNAHVEVKDSKGALKYLTT